MTEAHSFSAVWFGDLVHGHGRNVTELTGPSQIVTACTTASSLDDGRAELAREPLGDVLRRGIDAIERRHIIDAAVVELLRQRFELVPRADEIDGDGVGIDAARARREVRFDFVRVPVQRLGDAAVLAQKMRGFEAGGDADGEARACSFSPTPHSRLPTPAQSSPRSSPAPALHPASIATAANPRRGDRPSSRRDSSPRPVRSASATFCGAPRRPWAPRPEVYNAPRPPMPLPKSILCTACKKTYPEGWKRCPYCGFDEMRARQDGPIRKYMQRKLQEFEQRTGKKDERRGGGQASASGGASAAAAARAWTRWPSAASDARAVRSRNVRRNSSVLRSSNRGAASRGRADRKASPASPWRQSRRRIRTESERCRSAAANRVRRASRVLPARRRRRVRAAEGGTPRPEGDGPNVAAVSAVAGAVGRPRAVRRRREADAAASVIARGESGATSERGASRSPLRAPRAFRPLTRHLKRPDSIALRG